LERLRYVEQIYTDWKDKLKYQKKEGLISSRNMEYQMEKFNQSVIKGTVILTKNGKLVDYWTGIGNPIKFAQARMLRRKGDEVLFFKGQNLFSIEYRKLIEIPLK